MLLNLKDNSGGYGVAFTDETLKAFVTHVRCCGDFVLILTLLRPWFVRKDPDTQNQMSHLILAMFSTTKENK
jgi:hypothetical protein